MSIDPQQQAVIDYLTSQGCELAQGTIGNRFRLGCTGYLITVADDVVSFYTLGPNGEEGFTQRINAGRP